VDGPPGSPSLRINLLNLVPVTPLVSYVMGGWIEAKSRQPNDRDGGIQRLFHEAMQQALVGGEPSA